MSVPPTKESGSEYVATPAQHTQLVTMNELLRQADTLRREVERLRRALNDCTNTDDDYVYKTARAALEYRQ